VEFLCVLFFTVDRRPIKPAEKFQKKLHNFSIY